MSKIVIRRPTTKDIKELYELFTIVITDTFVKEGLKDEVEGINEQIQSKKEYLCQDIESEGKERYFLIATVNNKIVGTIEYGPVSQLILECTNNELVGYNEIGSVFVLPEYQKQGIGSLLLNSIYLSLVSNGIKEFCLDSGYTRAQKYWIYKLGEPKYILKDYWGKGFNHMIWCKKTKDIKILYNN